jgi:hypothetical protein
MILLNLVGFHQTHVVPRVVQVCSMGMGKTKQTKR